MAGGGCGKSAGGRGDGWQPWSAAARGDPAVRDARARARARLPSGGGVCARTAATSAQRAAGWAPPGRAAACWLPRRVRGSRRRGAGVPMPTPPPPPLRAPPAARPRWLLMPAIVPFIIRSCFCLSRAAPRDLPGPSSTRCLPACSAHLRRRARSRAKMVRQRAERAATSAWRRRHRAAGPRGGARRRLAWRRGGVADRAASFARGTRRRPAVGGQPYPCNALQFQVCVPLAAVRAGGTAVYASGQSAQFEAPRRAAPLAAPRQGRSSRVGLEAHADLRGRAGGPGGGGSGAWSRRRRACATPTRVAGRQSGRQSGRYARSTRRHTTARQHTNQGTIISPRPGCRASRRKT